MRKVRVVNLTRDIILLREAEVADTFWLRFRGLLGRPFLLSGTGLIIKPCKAVHTVGMKFPIDVAFVDGGNRICHIIGEMAAFRFSSTIKEAAYVIEAPAGTFRSMGTVVGDRLRIEE